MISTRTPLRISFAGGGSDLPAFFKDEPGCVVSATIDKYVYLHVNAKYDGAVRVSYSETENIAHARDVAHPLVRAALQLANIRSGIEVVSIADIPHGTGLGSSSAFTVGLLHALYAAQGEWVGADRLAHDACQVEIEACHSPIGKQDQYAAAFGGLRCYTFYDDGRVAADPLPVSRETRDALQQHLLLLDTGLRRDANVILAAQTKHASRVDVRSMANLAHAFRDALLIGRIAECGAIMDAAWSLKRRFASAISSDQIDDWYTAAKHAGALGGKLCGAGGGGFLLFLAPPETHGDIAGTLRLRRLGVRFSHHGSTVIYAEDRP
jgi:D-glycero-alpha-D-manno-heptose-7-phosphate kinase